MLVEMAARRKSLRPTNKIHHQLQIDDDVDDDMAELTVPVVQAANTSTCGSPHRNVLTYINQHSETLPLGRSSVFDRSPLSGQFLAAPHTTAPHIALPTDIYQDFEALKSATNMDSTELMRKLLTDFHKITSSSQNLQDNKLDGVSNEFFVSRPGNVLDLSKRKKSDQSNCSHDSGSSQDTTPSQDYTDDQLAMGILGKEHGTDECIDLKPLDLTLQKIQSNSAADIFEPRKLISTMCTPLSKSLSSSKEDSHCSHNFKHAGSYVIDLEPRSENPQLVNSSLAQVLSMDIPLHSLGSGSKQNLGSQETFFLNEVTDSSAHARNPGSECKLQLSQGIFRSKLFQDDADTSKLFKIGINETTIRDSAMSCLPSYAEAVTSVKNSHHNKRTHEVLSHDSSVGASQRIDKTETEERGISFVNINTEDSDMKMFPLNLNPQLMSPASSFEAHPKQQHNLLHQLLQHQLQSENTSQQHKLQTACVSQAQQNQHSITTFCGGAIPHVQMMQVPGLKSDVNNAHGLTQSIKPNDIQYPNFLLESPTFGHPANTTALSNISVSTNSMSNASMPMSTFFMTTSANGGVGHMVAIPVIHAVSDGITGLQPFAFAPHHVSLTNSDCSKSSQHCDDIGVGSQSTQSQSCSKTSDVQQNQELSNSDHSFTSEARSSPNVATAKSKPGRPRGRGGRGQSQKTQNKDMKLLTENMLFPGVYTSILKLPWSRRSRNKTKAKTISELKKQAQIIAHSRVVEDDSKRNDGDIKEECIEQEINNVKPTEQTCAQENIEKMAIDQQLELVNHHQLHQMENQKFKDLEQHQRLHLQYHIKLQEEQQKLAKQIEQSYINISSDSPIKIPYTTSSEQVFSDKQDKDRTTTFEREFTDSSASKPSESTLFKPLSLPQDSVALVNSNADISTPKKTPRKRGRPPKIPLLSSKATDAHSTFDPSTLVSSLVKYEPDNFLHSNVLSSNFSSVSADSKSNNSLSTYTPAIVCPDIDKYDLAATANCDLKRDVTLENKINFLTNTIGIELSQDMIAQTSSAPTMCIVQNVKCEIESGGLDDNTYQEMKLAVNKSQVDVKTRRKKVSRLLKSDENFMYATFKIKPKGLTPRKSRKRRKDVQASTSVVAETIVNLRQKALRESTTSRTDVDTSKHPSMVAWKFHEQYPCSNEEDDSKDRAAFCTKCGRCFSFEGEEGVSRECKSCFAEQTVFNEDRNQNETAFLKMNVADAEIKTECCITCGDFFQKHFSDPGARCDVCQNNAPRAIQSSKLFSFQDTSSDLASMTLKPSTMTSSFLEHSLKDRKMLDCSLAKINNSHLFCSLCRMEFAKICDYLAHIRDTHDTQLQETSQLLSSGSDQGRRTKISKTKKSLAHKTLTCPVEECPHFFREQKDLDLHFMRKHSHLSFSFHGNSFLQPDEHDIPAQTDHSLLTGEASQGISSFEQGMLANHNKSEAAVSACEKPLQCEFCPYRCRQKNALTWHMRKHPEAASQYRKYSNLSVD